MRIAIISDIHANKQALEAILNDISKQNLDGLFCLGDLVGYGPCPAEVLHVLKKLIGHGVIGNHDAVLAGKFSSERFNDEAKKIYYKCRLSWRPQR